MKSPLILIDGNDVNFFLSKSDLEKYVESPDISIYKVFDFEGKKLKLVSKSNSADDDGPEWLVRPSDVTLEIADGDNSQNELAETLRTILFQIDGIHYDGLLIDLLKRIAFLNGYDLSP